MFPYDGKYPFPYCGKRSMSGRFRKDTERVTSTSILPILSFSSHSVRDKEGQHNNGRQQRLWPVLVINSWTSKNTYYVPVSGIVFYPLPIP